MAKPNASRNPKPRTRQTAAGAISSFDIDEFVHRYIWLLVPLLVLLYYWFSTGSTGFYQDDEIGHYRNIRQFWGEPFSIMGNQPKPGWKILMVLPGLFGYTGVLLAHCLIAALTVVTTYYLGRTLKIRNSFLLAGLLAAQPLYLQLAFRSYSEITAGLFVVLMLLAWYRGHYTLAAIASSYIFSIRQEFALVSIGLGIVLLYRRQWIAFAALAWMPLLLAAIGWLATGNALWIIDDMRRIGMGVSVPHKPFWHYFGTYIFMVGPVTLALCLVGYWSFLSPYKQWKENLARYGVLFFTYTTMWAWAVISAWDLPNFGANPGHWRYMLSIAPLTAIYAGFGLNRMFEARSRTFVFGILAVLLFITLAFLSRTSDGLVLAEKVSYDKLAVVFGVVVLFALFAGGRVLPGGAFAVLLLCLGIGYTLYAEKPRHLDPEAATIKKLAEWYLSQPEEMRKRPLYCNHVLLRYFADVDINDKNRDRSMQKKTLETASKGSVVMWDSHYGNSQFGGDVPGEYFQNNPRYKFLKQFITDDQHFGALVFEKIE